MVNFLFKLGAAEVHFHSIRTDYRTVSFKAMFHRQTSGSDEYESLEQENAVVDRWMFERRLIVI